MRHRPARQPRARTARHHGHIQPMANLQHRLHLCIRLGQRNQQRPLAVGGEAVAFVGCRVLVVPQQGMPGQVGLKQRQKLCEKLGFLK